MAESVVMPKLGNTVESAILLAWHAQIGDSVRVGDLLCEIETDKATLEVESSATGTLLAQLVAVGEEAPVLASIAIVGEAGESIEALLPAQQPPSVPPSAWGEANRAERQRISPRARNLALRKQLDTRGIRGTGPQGRVIERDIEAALSARPSLTPVAQNMLDSGDYQLGNASGGRVTKADLVPATPARDVTEIPLRGTRKLIAQRMLHSLQSTAQLTLHASADATALRAFRARLKASDEALCLREIGINDLLLFAVARTLPQHLDLNAHFENETIFQHDAVHLAQAVDTERGLIVPVIRDADALSLRDLAAQARQLADACRSGKIQPDLLQGGTFTISNLGSYGIESFTPILNPPQVALLGVGSIQLKPVERAGDVAFIPHIGLSLTINHQVVDGAPAARFLAALGKTIADIDLLPLG